MGFEVLVVLFVVGFILEQVAKAKRKETESRPEASPRAPTSAGGEEEDLSIGAILREIQRVKAEAEARSGHDRPPLPRRQPLPPRVRPKLKPRSRITTDRGPMGRHGTTALPSAEEVEERETLEVTPTVTSLEQDPGLRERAVVDLDDEAEAVVRQRIAEAEARNREHRSEDHAAFHEKIAAPRAAASRHRLTPGQLRAAFIWREVLGPPVSERQEWE